MGYIYLKSKFDRLWTVGTYDGGKWEPESDHDTPEAAAARAAELNGGPSVAAANTIDRLARELAQERAQIMALREQFRQLTVAPCMSALLGDDLDGDCWCPSCRAKRALASPTTGWPDMVVALVKGARQAGVNRDLLAPFEGVE